MIEQGAFRIYYNNEVQKIEKINENIEIKDGMILQLGKLRYKKIRL